MAGATLTTLDKILKEYYLPPVVDQLNNEVLLLQRLESRSEDLFGKKAYVPVHIGRNTGIGPAGEGVALPDAGNQTYERAEYDLRYLYGRVNVTGPSMAKTASEAGAFLRSLKSELDGIRNDLKRDTARQAYGSRWGNGAIEQAGVTGASTTVVLGFAEAVQKGWLSEGMLIQIGTIASPALRTTTARSIVSIAADGLSMVISGAAVTTAITDYVSRATNGATLSAVDGEILGLSEYVNTTAGVAIGGLDPDTAGLRTWDNNRLMNSGTPRAVSITLLAQASSLSRQKGGDPSLMVGSLGMERALFLLLQSQVRYENPNDMDGGFKALEFMGRPYVADIDAPYGRITLLDEKFIKVFSNRDWHFLDEDGNVLKWVTGYDKWEAVLARYMNIGPTRRNAHTVLGDLTDAGI